MADIALIAALTKAIGRGGGGEQLLTELSLINAAANTDLLTELLATQDVKLKPGTYPVESTIVIDGHTLDMNGSKFTVPNYQDAAIFNLKGFGPCIKNGEIEGSYDKETTPSTYYSQTAITILKSSDAVIENMEIHHICGRGISTRLADKYGELDTITSADSYSGGVHTTAKRNIITGYKYMRTVGGYGYNSAYVVEPVDYIFYNDNDTEIGRVTEIPSINVEIPEGAVTYQLKLQTGKSGLTEGFVPLNCGFTNYNSAERIENCKIHDCMQWGIANLFGPSYLKNVMIYNYTVVGSSGMDIEDHQSPLIICEDCAFSGITPINAFYAYFTRCDLNYTAYAGKLHSFIDCKADIVFSENREYFKLPTIHVSGGIIRSNYGGAYDKAKADFIDKSSLSVTSGPIYFGTASNIMNIFSPTGFVFRKQSIAKAECVVVGRAVGAYVARYATGNSWVLLNTYPGSRLFIYYDLESTNKQSASALHAAFSGDCYGLIGVNVMIYPNGYTIYDSSFRPSGIGAAVNTTYTAGKYVNCEFDAINGHIVDIAQNASTTITFVNCHFKNLSENTLLSVGNSVQASTFTFINCLFEDAPITEKSDVEQYILPTLGVHTVTINDVSYTD